MVGAGLFPPQQRVKVLRLFILTPRKGGLFILVSMRLIPVHTVHHTLSLRAAVVVVLQKAAEAALVVCCLEDFFL
jgi:hypothetical protein